MYYIYFHIRLDNNKIFYIGKGTCSKHNTFHRKHSRAFCKKRSQFWNNIISKTEYKVVIDSYYEIESDCLDKEVELIAKYGFIKDGSGSLCNLSIGGESGSSGTKQSESQILKRISYIEKPVLCFDIQGNFVKEYKSASEASRLYGKSISNCLNNKQISAHNYIWVWKDRNNLEEKLLKINSKWSDLCIKVYQYSKDKKTLINEFSSIKEASLKLNIQVSELIV